MKKPELSTILICVLLGVVFAYHLLVAGLSRVWIWDEKFYVYTAQGLLHGVAFNFEHPPLVKLIIAGAILVFGDNWFAWRILSLVSTVAATYLTYKIGREFLSGMQALFAAALLSTSVIFFLVGSAAMLDVPMLAFCLGGLYLVLKQRYIYAGILFGLGFLCKELTLVFVGVALVFLLVKHIGFKKILPFLVVFTAVSLVGMQLYELFYQQVVFGITITNPFQNLAAIILYQFGLNSIRGAMPIYYYPAIAWVTPFGTHALTPEVWTTITYGSRLTIQWLSQPNPMVEYTMFPLLAALPLLYRKLKDNASLMLWLWLAFAYLPWLIASFFFKLEANFYIDSADPALALGIVLLLSQVKVRRTRQTIGIIYFVASAAFFIYYFPLLSFLR